MGAFFRKVLILISGIVFLISSVSLINILIIQPTVNNRKNQEVRYIYYDQETVGPDPIDKFRALLEINSDIKGWIKVDNTAIDYPVLKSNSSDPGYYLYRDYKKNYTKYGSIFIDSNSEEGVGSKNIVVHGHNMNDGSMFAKLLKYTNIDFYKSTPSLTFDTIYEKSKWKVISVFRTNTLEQQGPVFNYLRGTFQDKEDFMEFVKNILDRTLIKTTVDVNENDRLITLSTCSYEFKDFRTVVVARKVRDGETDSIDTSGATVNPNPVLPQCYTRIKRD